MGQTIGELSTAAFADVIARAHELVEPAICRNFAGSCAVVVAGSKGADRLLDYLASHGRSAPVSMIHAPPSARGKFGYGEDLKTFNFTRSSVDFLDFVARLNTATYESGQAVALQGVIARDVLSDFAKANTLPEVPAGGEYRLWLGTRAEVAAHCDPAPNVAYVACGKRRFTLFAPEEIGNLYLGPFDPTPSGTQISLADPLAPDYERFPRLRGALDRSRTAILEPGDAIFIPTGWYHHVEALAPLNLLVNYWWTSGAPGPSPWDALMHGFMALRPLSPAERRVWQAMFAHYIFETDGDPAAHIPLENQGILATPTGNMLEAMRKAIVRSLTVK